jgi:hypothetical protein
VLTFQEMLKDIDCKKDQSIRFSRNLSIIRAKDLSQCSFNWHRGSWSGDAFSFVYAEERDTANSHRWRKEGLELLVCKLQLTKHRDKVYEIIDKYFKKFAEEEQDTEYWRFRLLRTDLRNCKVIEDKEINGFRFVNTTELEPDLQEQSDIALAPKSLNCI